YLAAQRVLGYWAIVGLGGSEDMVALLMGPFILSCLFTAVFIMPILAKFMPVKWLWFLSFVIIATGLPGMYPIAASNLTTPLLPAAWNESWMAFLDLDVAGANKVLLAIILFLYCGVGQGIQYVVTVALIGEIIDLDEQTSGERREAVYNGVSGIAFKAGYAFSLGLAGLSMHFLGNSVEHPLGIYLVGPFAGLFGLFGILIVWRYPVLNVTPEKAADLSP
ncbi:MAG: MFS transporter, partial [Candidatus Hydrogenedentes bacterium]|nr:MFS transporter [Candidatus Hydrogenedentota bacterium]